VCSSSRRHEERHFLVAHNRATLGAIRAGRTNTVDETRHGFSAVGPLGHSGLVLRPPIDEDRPPADPVRLLARVERLAMRLLRANWKGASDLWKFQLDLLALQQDAQAAITQAKTQSKTTDRQRRLEELREARWQARRLGDAFAWLLLGLEQRNIHPLGDNHRTSVSQDDHGTRGLLAIAQHLANQGWGFPVLHDVTDCLRIGDITFVDPAGGEHDLQTVEIKTRLKDQRPAPDGKTQLDYQVTVVSPLPGHPSPTIPTSEPTPDDHRRNRLDRQLQRMTKALTTRLAPDNTVTHPDGKPTISTTVSTAAPSHWDTVRRVIRKARRTGAAHAVAEDAFLYMAWYHRDGITAEALAAHALPDDLHTSRLFRPRNHPNALVIYTIPPPQSAAAHRFLPYYLYPLPKTSIADLLHGRLAIAVLINPAAIAEAFETAGFQVVNPTGKLDLRPGSLTLTTTATTRDNRPYRLDLHNIEWHMAEAIYEFKSVQYLVDIATHMRDTAASVAPPLQDRSVQSE
jgi:hypothetical protein